MEYFSISSWSCINYYLNHLFQPLQPCKQAESPSNTSWAFVWAAWNCTLHRQQATAERSTKGTTDNKWNCHWIHCIFIKATLLPDSVGWRSKDSKGGWLCQAAANSSSWVCEDRSRSTDRPHDPTQSGVAPFALHAKAEEIYEREPLRTKNAVALSWWWQTGGLREKDRSFGDYD